ncbi:MAG: hypothetical protein V1644_03950 [Candidatus Micrarchaeota archaeon]
MNTYEHYRIVDTKRTILPKSLAVKLQIEKSQSSLVNTVKHEAHYVIEPRTPSARQKIHAIRRLLSHLAFQEDAPVHATPHSVEITVRNTNQLRNGKKLPEQPRSLELSLTFLQTLRHPLQTGFYPDSENPELSGGLALFEKRDAMIRTAIANALSVHRINARVHALRKSIYRNKVSKGGYV